MENISPLEINVTSNPDAVYTHRYDFDQIIYEIDSKLDTLSTQADSTDYIIAIASGLLCGMLDILWVGNFSLENGRNLSSEKVNGFVVKAAKQLGYDGEDVNSAVKFLEKKFPVPSDGNTPDFGGGLQHHLRDFAHHPTVVGLAFSLLTQFTYKSLITAVIVATAGAFAPKIAVLLVGTKFAGLSGAALTSACLAYLGGGAIAVGGYGMAGGTIAIVGGGAALGLGLGATTGSAVGAVALSGNSKRKKSESQC